VQGLGNECSNIEPPPFFGATEAELRACAAAGYEAFFGDATQSITVDGVTVSGLEERYRTQTPLFSYTLPPDNLYGLPPATARRSRTAAVIVKPLPPAPRIVITSSHPPWERSKSSTTSRSCPRAPGELTRTRRATPHHGR
jgi:hypothetical protein